MSLDLALDDPWAVTDPSRRPSGTAHDGSVAPRPDRRGALVAASTALGAWGPVVALFDDGPDQRRAALAVIVVAAATAVALVGPRHATTASVTADGRSDGATRLVVALVAAAVATGAAVIAVGVVGRAPVLLAVLGVIVADGAVRLDRRPPLGALPPGRAQRTTAVATPALPFLLASGGTWVAFGSLVVTVGLLAVATVVVAWCGRRPVAAARLGAVLERAAVAAGAWFGTLLVLVVATPLLYVPGALGRLAQRLRHPRRRRDDGRTAWVVDLPGAAVVRRDAPYQFASTRPADRYRRTAQGLALVAALLAVAIVADRVRDDESTTAVAGRDDGFNFRYSRTPFTEREDVPYTEREALADQPDTAGLERDQRKIVMTTDAVGGTRVEDIDSEFLNVTDGERRTLRPSCDCPRLRVWFVGGSAAFGIAQRDDHTVASALVRAAERDDIGLEVRNLGAPAWTIWQEYQAVAARLALGEEPPDLVVFYDGFNDVVGTLFESALRGPDPDTPTLLANADVWDVVEQGATTAEAGGGRVLGRLAATKYLGVADLADRTVAAAGGETVHVLQPDALASPRQRRAAAISFGPDLEILRQVDMEPALDAAEAELAPHVVNLRQLFDDRRDLVFVDSVHHNESAAQAVADAIWAALRDRVERRVARS